MTFEELVEKVHAAQSREVSDGPPSRSKVQDLETILGIVRIINTSLVLSDVLELVVDEAIRITKADRGFLMLEVGNRKLEFVVGRNSEGRSIDADNFQVSSSILEDVFTTGESICIENALADERFERRQSIMDLELQTITCSPLRTQDETIGVIYVDSKLIHAVDKADILNFFEILAGQAAIAIKNARLYEDLKKSYDDLKQANEQVINFERMAMKGEIAGEVSHELKNLIAVVMLNLQVLQKRINKISAEEIKSIIDKTVDGATKIQNFSQSLLTRSHASGNRLPASLNKLVREFVEFMQVVPKFKQNHVSSILADDLPDVELDIDQIQQVLLNLVTNAIEAFPDVLELVVDEAIRITKADRGFLMLEVGNRKLEFVVGRNSEGRSIDADNFQVSSSILEDVFTTGESICIENALADERFERRQSIMDLELQTITCSPLRTQDETIGVIYVDSKLIHAVDKADILNFFEILAGQAAIAIKNARLYEDLKKSYDDLKQANEQVINFERMAMKGEIAGEVSHELKNLIAVVMLNLQVLQKRINKISAEEIKSIIDKTVDGATKIQNFSQSLLTRSHASGNRLPASLNKLVREFVEFMQVVPKFKQNHVSSILADDLPDVELDIDQIQQVLLNLVTNAIEAFPAAAIEFTTEYDVEAGEIDLCVKDNGPGIDDSIRDKLFNENMNKRNCTRKW